MSFRSRRATRPIIYWSTGRKQGEGDEAAAAQQGAAAANGDANGAAAAAEDEDLSPEEQKRRARRGGLDLDAIVDLSELDLSILQRPARMPPLARVRLDGGTQWLAVREKQWRQHCFSSTAHSFRRRAFAVPRSKCWARSVNLVSRTV